MRDKRKNGVVLPLREPISLSEFEQALRIVQSKAKNKNKINQLVGAWEWIALYIFYFSGLWVSNLLNLTWSDVETFFLWGSEQETSVWVIKKKEKVIPHHMMVSKAVLNKYVFGEFNLLNDFDLLKSNAIEALKKEHTGLEPFDKTKIDLRNIPFYTSYKTPLKGADRVTITSNINKIMKEVNKQNPSTWVLSSHSFRINMITTLIKHKGIEFAREYASHAETRPSSLYNWNIFNPNEIKDISGILANTWTGKKYIEELESKEEDVQKAVDILEKITP